MTETPIICLSSVGIADAPLRVPQHEALDFILKNFRVKDATKTLYERVFKNNSIETRAFAMNALENVLEDNHDVINQRFQEQAVALSTQSLNAALKKAKRSAIEIDFIVVTTCTGYLCPGISSYLIETCGLRPDVRHLDVVGMGCGAALPAIDQAAQFIKANPKALAAVVSTEICSAAMYSDDAAELVVSNAIFADGSAAALIEAKKPGAPDLIDFDSLLVPEWREAIRFRTDHGHLRNVLTKEIPLYAAKAMQTLVTKMAERNNLAPTDLRHWVLHAGGEKVIDAISHRFNLTPAQVEPTRAILRTRGNLSSPTVLYVLYETQTHHHPKAGEWGIMASFGAGFSAHATLIRF